MKDQLLAVIIIISTHTSLSQVLVPFRIIVMFDAWVKFAPVTITFLFPKVDIFCGSMALMWKIYWK
jgi:hypothetical protein